LIWRRPSSSTPNAESGLCCAPKHHDVSGAPWLRQVDGRGHFPSAWFRSRLPSSDGSRYSDSNQHTITLGWSVIRPRSRQQVGTNSWQRNAARRSVRFPSHSRCGSICVCLLQGLFVSQGDRGIDAHRAPRGDIASHQRRDGKHGGDSG
jgi:hypothetical protein